MEEFFGTAIFVIFLAISLFSRMNRSAQQRNRRMEPDVGDDDDTPRMDRPTWPGPVAGPGIPRYPKPEWPQAPAARWQEASPERTAESGAPATGRVGGTQVGGTEGAGIDWAGAEGLRTDRRGTEGVWSEGFGTEGPAGSMADVVARFAAESDRFRSTRFETELSSPDRLEVEPSPSVAASAGRFRLPRAEWARAVVLSEILGKPISLRRRK